MDENEEGIHERNCVAAVTTVILAPKSILQEVETRQRRRIPREPYVMHYQHRQSSRIVHMQHILDGSSSSCVDYLRIRKMPFLKLAKLIRELGLMSDTVHVTVEEQLTLFLHIVGHKTKNRVMRVEFIRSGKTFSRYFNQALRAICALRDHFMKQPTGNTPLEIASHPNWFPYFEDYIGWEGSANNFTVLKDALSRPPPHGIRVLEGYTTDHGFIAPYRGTRYHLKEHSGRTPNNRRELFNLRHSNLHTKIEACFRILKNRFKILSSRPHHLFLTQVDIVLACAILHNYIAITDTEDEILNKEEESLGEEGEVIDDDSPVVVGFDVISQTQSQLRVNREE